jgi:hypothetical protein
MIRDALYYKNRINLLTSRGTESNKIVKKLQRQLRRAEAKK